MLSHSALLDRVADDPEGWAHPLNRFKARLIVSLRAAGVADEVIYRAISEADERVSERLTKMWAQLLGR